MKNGNVVVSDALAESYKRWFPTERQVVALSESDLTDAAVVVLSEEDVQDGKGKEVEELGWGLPVIACVSAERKDLIGKGEIDDVITKDRIQS